MTDEEKTEFALATLTAGHQELVRLITEPNRPGIFGLRVFYALRHPDGSVGNGTFSVTASTLADDAIISAVEKWITGVPADLSNTGSMDRPKKH